MNNEYPQRSDEKIERMQQEVARQQIAAEQAQENARFLASENSTLRNRIYEGSNGFMHMFGILMVIATIVASVLFLTSSNKEVRQQAEATRQEAEATRLDAAAARNRANTALDTANRAGLRSQDASITAQQATSAAIRAEQNAQKPTVIIPPPPPAPPTVILTPAEPAQPAPTTTIPDNPEPKPLEGRIE